MKSTINNQKTVYQKCIFVPDLTPQIRTHLSNESLFANKRIVTYLTVEDKLKVKVILLECAVFSPYYNLNKRGLNIRELKKEYEKDHTSLYDEVEKNCLEIDLDKEQVCTRCF